MVAASAVSSTNRITSVTLGGAEGTRTPDPLHAMQVRYQLRHSPVVRPRAYLADGPVVKSAPQTDRLTLVANNLFR